MSSEFEKIASKIMIQVRTKKEEALRCLYYEPKKETKQTIVLIPGFFSLPSAWDELLMNAKEEYRLFLIETREKHTAKINKKSDFSLDRFANDIAEAIDYLMLKDYILVTSSMGGAFTLTAMKKGLINPKHSFLVGPVLKVEIPDWSWPLVRITSPFFYRFMLKPSIKIYVKRKFERDQAEKYCVSLDNLEIRRVRKTMLTLKKFRITAENLNMINSHCILIGAEKDKLHQSQITKWIHEQIPNSDYVDLGSNVVAHGISLLELIEKTIEEEKS
ncbi:MAG: alpha/beta fold hydrolase [Candidatus Heimdallarchaeaceae archaeon]